MDYCKLEQLRLHYFDSYLISLSLFSLLLIVIFLILSLLFILYVIISFGFIFLINLLLCIIDILSFKIFAIISICKNPGSIGLPGKWALNTIWLFDANLIITFSFVLVITSYKLFNKILQPFVNIRLMLSKFN